MSRSDSDLPLPKAAKLVVRVFLAQLGCCHFRAETVSNSAAREVLEALSQIDEEHHTLSQSLTKELFLPSHRKAFYHTRREPDPNSPRRRSSHVWVWLPDSQTESLEQAQLFFNGHSLPRSEDDISQCQLRRVQETDTASTAPNKDDTAPRQYRSAKRHLSLWLLLAGCAVVLAVIIARRSETLPLPAWPSAGTRPIVSPEWNDGVQFEIRRKLEAAGEPNVDALDPATLLQHFVELFHSPSFTGSLTKKQLIQLERFQQSGVPHPFLDFIARLPDGGPAPATGPKGETWPELAEAHLRPLAKQLQHPGVRVSAAPLELMLDLHNFLNYKSFFNIWQETHPEYDRSDPWCEEINQSGPEDREFLDELRKLMRKRYAP